jgi:hypothetical protein
MSKAQLWAILLLGIVNKPKTSCQRQSKGKLIFVALALEQSSKILLN